MKPKSSKKKRADYVSRDMVIVVPILGILSEGFAKFEMHKNIKKNADYAAAAANLATAANLYLQKIQI